MRLWLLVLATVGAVLAAAACGGSSGGGSSTSGSSTTPPQNVQPIIVNAGPTNDAVDEAFTSVTICVPGSTTDCQTID
jgi:ABC-type glycerol-3-phosphate transport system substrate-binding protein